jgi:nicotinate-nucleotide--dimethylbenzimidazole phosphoribosyltransferase
MVANFLAGGAAINVLASLVDAEVVAVDVGIRAVIPEPPEIQAGVRARLIRARVRAATRDLSEESAMTRAETIAAVDIGIRLAAELRRAGVELVAVGEMGIGNTTSASAIVAALTRSEARTVTGRGTGVDDVTFERKVAAIERGLRRLGQTPDPLVVLDEVGGLEIAALTGFILGAAGERIPVVLDGFITGAAALVGARLCPALPTHLVAAHRSAEPGHDIALQALGLEPLLDLGMRLGEGSGAALALALVDAACALRDDMTTFDAAQVPGPSRSRE